MKFLKNKAKKALMAAVTMSLVMGVCGSAMAGNTYCGQNDGTWGTAAQATTGFTGVWDDKSGVDRNGEATAVLGGYSTSSAVSSNTVTIRGGSMDSVYGALMDGEGAFDASLNVVTVNGTATFRSSVSCASTYGGAALYNTFNINGGNFKGLVLGAEARTNAEGNIVNISGGTLEPETKRTQAVYGGYSYSGIAKGNIVNISGGTINIPVIAGGTGNNAEANNNTVNLIGNDGKLYATVGYDKEGAPLKEIVEHKGTEAINIGDIVYGSGRMYSQDGDYFYKPAKTSSGNTLNVAGKNTTVGNIASFQNLNFYIQNGLTYGDTMVNITSSEETNIEGAKVGVIVEAKPKDNGDDKTVNLLKKVEGKIYWTDTPKEGDNYTIVVKEGAKLTLDNTKNGVAVSEDGTALVLTLGGIEETKDDPKPTYNMGTPAAISLINDIVKNEENLTDGLKGFSKSLTDRFLSIVTADKANAPAAIANIQAAVSGAFQASEITGTTSTAVSVVNNVSNMTMSRMSLVDVGGGANGGKGVGLMAPDSGADVWARYVHGKDKADGMKMDGGSAEYSNNYNGVVVGADFKKVGKFQSGISFSYVKGSGNNTFKDVLGATARYGHTDFHTYNFGYYGSVKNDDTNTMFDLSYGTTSADSDTNGIGGAQSFSSKSKIFNAGVTAEKSFDVSGMKLVPYTGLRYMHVDGGEYTDSLGINHKADKQNVFMLPVGFKLSKENKLSHDWTLTPKLDLSYTWNMGDTDNAMTVSVPGLTASNLSYSVMDKGSFMGVAGIEAEHKNCTYGVSYAYQKGSHQDSKKIIADIKWTF